MITKAIIVGKSKIDGEDNKYIVRIPIIHGVEGASQYTPDDLLPTAPICGIPGFTNTVRKGDVVFVVFENDEYEHPVIMGQLITNTNAYNVNSDNITNTRANAVLQTLSFYDKLSDNYTSAQLPKNTTIGDVKASQISFLLGLRDNIQDQIDRLNEQLSGISATIDRINGEVV